MQRILETVGVAGDQRLPKLGLAPVLPIAVGSVNRN